MRVYLLYLKIFEEEVTVHVLGLEIEIVIGPGISHEKQASAAGEDDQKEEKLS